MTGAFLAGLVAGYGVAIPVGAIAILILGLSARTSFRVGAAAALGVASADGLYAAVAALGGAAVASGLAPVAGPLRLVAAGVLLALACLTAWRALRPSAPTPEPSVEGGPAGEGGPAREGRPHRKAAARGGLDTPVRAFAAVLALTLLNPATVVYFVALVLGRGDVLGGGPAGAGAFTAGVFLASASWQLLIAGGGTLIGRALTGPRGRQVTALLSSVIIAVLAVATVLDV
ncbi:LysE family transporter [Micromonospora sp. WMMA1949]|uniref:LysE family transporter n=1 Tax=unclassified Micromonospora TaxID=2617518 RepID=UPI0022B647A6|nr:MULTISPECIES: LysE family transporter [unclassified Micromonospora]MCZ7428411.1 LysE family transporter [Micromonospora sp. WMMA1949]WBC07305.1 LysE family transporter [Micromonospora sp. WMMA1947]